MVLRIDLGGVKNYFKENVFAAMPVAQTPYI